MHIHSRALAVQSQNVLASFRNSKSSSSQLLSSLKLDNKPPNPQLELEIAQLIHAPVRRTRYLPELDMEVEIIEPPRKTIVNKHLRVRALREHWDEKEIHPVRRHSCIHNPLRFEISKPRT